MIKLLLAILASVSLINCGGGGGGSSGGGGGSSQPANHVIDTTYVLDSANDTIKFNDQIRIQGREVLASDQNATFLCQLLGLTSGGSYTSKPSSEGKFLNLTNGIGGDSRKTFYSVSVNDFSHSVIASLTCKGYLSIIDQTVFANYNGLSTPFERVLNYSNQISKDNIIGTTTLVNPSIYYLAASSEEVIKLNSNRTVIFWPVSDSFTNDYRQTHNLENSLLLGTSAHPLIQKRALAICKERGMETNYAIYTLNYLSIENLKAYDVLEPGLPEQVYTRQIARTYNVYEVDYYTKEKYFEKYINNFVFSSITCFPENK